MKAQRRIIHRARCMLMRQAERHWLILPSAWGWKADIRHNKHLGFYRIAYRNDVLIHREDLAAVGGFVVHAGKIASGCYRGQPRVYAGYMNRMDLYQNVNYLDIRNLEVNKAYFDVYEEVTGHPCTNVLLQRIHRLRFRSGSGS